jgi:hypothetical protein
VTASHRRALAAEGTAQSVWLAFGGVADQPWLRLLRPASATASRRWATRRAGRWLEPLSGRLLVARLPVAAGFDLPGFYRRAGLRVLGPFAAQRPPPGASAAARPLHLRRALPRPARPPWRLSR